MSTMILQISDSVPKSPTPVVTHHEAPLAFRYEHIRDLFDNAIDLALRGKDQKSTISRLDDALYRFQLWASDISVSTATRDGSAQDVLQVFEQASGNDVQLGQIHKQFHAIADALLLYIGDGQLGGYHSIDDGMQRIISSCLAELSQFTGQIREVYMKSLENKSKPPRRSTVLCFDGGGVRSYSSLLILKELMVEVRRVSMENEPELGGMNAQQPTKPRDYFDYIFGSSSGGLIAIMLGRLRMDVNECIDSFERYVTEVFGDGPRPSLPNFFGQAKYDTRKLETAIHNVVRDFEPDSEKHPWKRNTFATLGDHCRCAVVAMNDYDPSLEPYLFRTYDHPSPDRSLEMFGLADVVPIWKVARATSAAPTYFKPITIEKKTFVDGGISFNNPAHVAFKEVNSMHEIDIKKAPDSQRQEYLRQNEVAMLVSIGSGATGARSTLTPRPPHSGFRGLLSLLRYAIKSLTDAEGVHRTMVSLTQVANDFHYSRINVMEGIGDIKLDECKTKRVDGKRVNLTLEKIRTVTEEYLQRENVRQELHKVAKQLVLRRRPYV